MTKETESLLRGAQDTFNAPLPVGERLRAGISLAAAGSMALSRRGTDPSFDRFLRHCGIPPSAACGVHQVHSRRVLVLDGRTDVAALAATDADGMVTDRTDLTLTVTVADCLPLILEDTTGPAFGLVHSGWRGTGIVGEALRLMERTYGTTPQHVRATIGPGIGACCYAVPEERADLFAAQYGPHSVVRDPKVHGGAPRLDLRAANAALLERAGVASITVVPDCTSCTPQLGSFRRQGAQGYTLMLAWVGRSA